MSDIKTPKSETKNSLAAQAATLPKPAKKRTIYSPKGMLELPREAAEDKEHKYRWVSKRRNARSDGFDPRGWVIYRDSEGKTLEAHDAILYRMPIDEWQAMKEYKDNIARTQIQTVLDNIESQQDRLRFEVEKLGGRIESNFTIERNK